MKKLFLFAAAALVIGLVACDKKKGDDNPGGGGGDTELNYTEPVLAWGDVPSEFMPELMGAEWENVETFYSFEGDPQGVIRGIAIVGSGDVSEYVYIFNGNIAVPDGQYIVDIADDGELEEVDVEFATSKYDAFKAFLDDNYIHIGAEQGREMYVDSETSPTTGIILIRNTGSSIIAYVDYTLLARSANSIWATAARNRVEVR